MNILWQSVSVYATTAYGKITKEILARLLKAGYNVISCGHESDVTVWGSKKTLNHLGQEITSLVFTNPLINSKSAAEMLKAYIDQYDISFVIAFWDAFSLGYLSQVGVPYGVYVPIDSPMTPKWKEYIKDANYIIAYSKFGYNELLKFFEPSKCRFIPHGIDTSIFKPRKAKKSDIKASPPIPDDAFLFTYVATNVGERKQIVHLMKTFKKFVEKYNDAHLYLHTNPHVGQMGRGYDLPMYRAMLGLEDKIHFPTMNPILEPSSDEELSMIYSATDTYLQPSVAEGFGMPTLEACACGTMPIVANNSASVELAKGHGLIIENIDPDEHVHIPVYTPYLTECPVPNFKSLFEKMEIAYKNDELRKEYRKKAIEFALQYDWEKIMPMWYKLLDEVEDDLELFKSFL